MNVKKILTDVKKVLKFCYGILLGTSVQYVEGKKPKSPSHFYQKSPNFWIMSQDDHDVGIFRNGDEIFLMNTSYSTGTEDLYKFLQQNFSRAHVGQILVTQDNIKAHGGLEYFPGTQILADKALLSAKRIRNALVLDENSKITFGDFEFHWLPQDQALQIRMPGHSFVYQNLKLAEPDPTTRA